MSEVENLADRFSIIRQGKIIRNDSLEGLRASSFATIRATLASDPAEGTVVAGTPISSREVALRVRPDAVGEAVSALAGHGLESIDIQQASLEEMFLSLYEEA